MPTATSSLQLSWIAGKPISKMSPFQIHPSLNALDIFLSWIIYEPIDKSQKCPPLPYFSAFIPVPLNKLFPRFPKNLVLAPGIFLKKLVKLSFSPVL